MKKVLKSRLFVFLLGFIIAGGIGVVATVQFQANEVGYKNTTVDKVLDDLYDRISGTKVVCLLISGQAETVGSKYACDPGDGNVRYFYVLKANTTNVEMIMEKNLSDEVTGSKRVMSWNEAINYFNNGNSGYSIKSSWVNVQNIDLPTAQDIVNVGGITGWNGVKANYYFGGSTDTRSNYSWLYNYTRGCSASGCNNSYDTNDSNHAYGYWTKDLTVDDSSRAWRIDWNGTLDGDPIINEYQGVRPVITIAKSKLSS